MRRPKFDAENYRDQPKRIAECLNDALQTGDAALIAGAIGDMVRIHSMSALARKIGMDRKNLYRSFGGEAAPRLDTVMKTFVGLGLELEAKPARKTRD